jgi:hypothetical protein
MHGKAFESHNSHMMRYWCPTSSMCNMACMKRLYNAAADSGMYSLGRNPA